MPGLERAGATMPPPFFLSVFPPVSMNRRLALRILLGCLPLAACQSTRDYKSPLIWGDIRAGATRESVIQRLGPPAGTSEREGDFWRSGDWELVVRYDESRNVESVSQGLILR